jgi:multidrug efflux pump subunit AcrA (membrane-fusion protein)
MQPAQAQYLQNVANQEATFGGTGNLGSARQALAERQLAGTTQATQAQTAAQVQANIAQQRAAAAQSLAGIGSGGLTSAQQAAQNVVTAGMTPQQLYNQYASVIFGTPSSSYATNFAGTQGQTKTGGSLGINI